MSRGIKNTTDMGQSRKSLGSLNSVLWDKHISKATKVHIWRSSFWPMGVKYGHWVQRHHCGSSKVKKFTMVRSQRWPKRTLQVEDLYCCGTRTGKRWTIGIPNFHVVRSFHWSSIASGIPSFPNLWCDGNGERHVAIVGRLELFC